MVINKVFVKILKCFIMIELTLLKDLIVITQVLQKSIIFLTISTFYIKGLSFSGMSATYDMTN